MSDKCGTPAGYHAHYRRGEEACEDCKRATAEYEAGRRREAKMRAAEDFREALELEPEVEDHLDELEDLKDNLRLVRARMKVAKSDPSAAALSKQRMDIVRRIKELEAERDKAGGVLGGLDAELANIIRPNFSEGRTGT